MIERFSIKQAGAVADTIANGTDVPVDGVIDLEVALQYGNHSSVQQYSAEIVQKIFDDVRFGTASIFPRNFAHTYIPSIPGLHLSSMGAVWKPNKLTFRSSRFAGSVSTDTAVGSAPDVELGRVLRDII